MGWLRRVVKKTGKLLKKAWPVLAGVGVGVFAPWWKVAALGGSALLATTVLKRLDVAPKTRRILGGFAGGVAGGAAGRFVTRYHRGIGVAGEAGHSVLKGPLYFKHFLFRKLLRR